MIKDCYYYKACEYAKDDHFMFGIRRTQQEVEREAERLRKQALLRGGFKTHDFKHSGLTSWVAEHYGRDSIGIELSPEYCELINKRMSNRQMTLFEGRR